MKYMILFVFILTYNNLSSQILDVTVESNTESKYSGQDSFFIDVEQLISNFDLKKFKLLFDTSMINYHSDSLINDIKEINKIAQQNKNKIEIHSSWNSNNLTIYIGHRTIWIFYKPSSRFQEKSDYKITSFRSKCFGSVEGRSFPEELKTYMELWYKIQNNTITDIDTILNMVAIGDSLRNLKALHDIWFEVVYEKALLHQIGRGYKLSLLLNHTYNHNRLRTKEQAFEFLYKIIHKEEQISKAFYSELDFEVKEKIKKYVIKLDELYPNLNSEKKLNILLK